MFESLKFIDFTFVDGLDILVVGLMIYYIYKMLSGTVAINIIFGIVIIFVMWKITSLIGMELLSGILGQFVGMGFLALVVVFQQEIRKFLLAIGSTKLSGHTEYLKKIFSLGEVNLGYNLTEYISNLVNACEKMGSERTGALIILERNQSLDFVKVTGDKMNIEVNEPILESIFYKNSPLHDGAIVISKNYIVATRVILPVVSSAGNKIPKQYGLRHRAAISVTEKTDATALVVSEETGLVSYIKNGDFVPYENSLHLIALLKADLM